MDYYYSAKGVYRNSKGEIVYGKDPDRKVQIVAPGGYIPMAQARFLGLIPDAPTEEVVAEPAAVEVDEEVEEKAVTATPENKAVTAPPRTKAGKGKK